MPRQLRRVTGSQPQRGGNKGSEVRPWLSRPMLGVLLIAVGLKFQRCADLEILRPHQSVDSDQIRDRVRRQMLCQIHCQSVSPRLAF